MKVTIIRVVLHWLGDLLLKAALDAASKRALSRAIEAAEKTGGKGQAKMLVALDHLKTQGTESLKSATESKLRTLIEEQLDRI